MQSWRVRPQGSVALARCFPVCRARCTLPDGRVIDAASTADVRFIYDEVFGERCYGSHGLVLRPGDTVLDVGANVGISCLFFAAAVSPGGTVVACEPAPAAFASLQSNVAQHCGPSSDVRLLSVGVSDGAAASASLTMYPHISGWSTLAPDEAETAANVSSFAVAAVPATLAAAFSWRPLRLLGAALASLASLLAPLLRLASRAVTAVLLRGRHSVTVPLTTVSSILATQKLSTLSLLKIDVERAELAVLRGVAASDWPRISQVVAEVHDASGRLAEVMRLLRFDASFRTVTSVQPPSLAGTNLWMVYAMR